MIFQLANMMPATSEIFVLAMICVILLVDLFVKRYPNLVYLLTQLTLFGAALITATSIDAPKVILFHGNFVQDPLSAFLKLFIYLSSFLAFLFSQRYVEERGISKGEYYLLGLFSILGMMVLVSAYSLLTIFLGLELVSLPLYAMVALHRNSYQATEAAIKYFVMGSLASGILLYGLSMLYGATGTLVVNELAKVIASTPTKIGFIFSFGLVFVVLGVAFKIAAAPFHMWAPDVYQGAPSSVVLLLGSAPKLAAFGMAVRLLVEALPNLFTQWQQLLTILAILSLAFGNLVAIMQMNIKRMLAYSAIANTGYMLLGFIAGTPEGYGSAMFYMVTYSLMAVGSFAVIVLMSKAGFEAEKIDDFKGLNARSPWLAFMMLIIMFSMGGIPPTVGFFAKLGVINALINANQTWLAIVAMVFAVIGIFYYLRVISVMYFKAPDQTATPIVYTPDLRLAISINGLGLLLMGIFPGTLMTACRAIFGALV